MNEYSERLSHLDSCAVSDALDQLGLSGAVTGLGRVSTDQRIAGQVLTVRMGLADGQTNPPPLCAAAIEASSPGDIIVVEQRTGLDAASWGGNLTIGAQMRGVAGAIIEGFARDIDESRQLGFPVFARAITGRAARTRIMQVATGEPITVGEVTVEPGDYVIADASSVVFVKQVEIVRVLETAESILSRESAMAQALREGKPFSQVMTGAQQPAATA